MCKFDCDIRSRSHDTSEKRNKTVPLSEYRLIHVKAIKQRLTLRSSSGLKVELVFYHFGNFELAD